MCAVGRASRATDRRRRVSRIRIESAIRIPATGWATYADATIICGPLEGDPESPTTCTNPAVIVEVLKSNRASRREQFLQIESLRDVVVLDPYRPHAEQWTRDESGCWNHRVIAPDGEIVLDPVGGSFALADLYNFSTTSPNTYAA